MCLRSVRSETGADLTGRESDGACFAQHELTLRPVIRIYGHVFFRKISR